MSSEFGASASGGNEDDLTALEKLSNKIYNGVCGVLYGRALTFFFSCSALAGMRLNLFSFFFSCPLCELLVSRFVMSKETAGSSVTVMGGMMIDFLQSAHSPFTVLFPSTAVLFSSAVVVRFLTFLPQKLRYFRACPLHASHDITELLRRFDF
jgi:hypothetical protein